MKKIVVLMFAVLCFAPAAFADNWGYGYKLGVGENRPSDLKDLHNYFSGFPSSDTKLETSGAFFAAETFYEWSLSNEVHKIGAKVDFDYFLENKTESQTTLYQECTETTYAIPLTIYYKRDNGVKAFAWFGGAGATIMYTEMQYKGYNKNIKTKSKIIPHIVVGGEYRFSQLFALGLEARYNFDAKVKKSGILLSDRSGFGGAVTLRFYL